MTKKNQETPIEEKDLIISFFTGAAKFYKKHQQAVLTAVGILIVAALVQYAYVTHQHKVQEESWAAFYQAQQALAVSGEADGFFRLDKIQKDFPNSPAAQYAQLLKGDFLYARENFAQAVDAYRPLISSKNEMVRTAATISLADALQATNNYNESVNVITSFIQNEPSNFALPQAYLTLALSQELAGNKTEAVKAYQYLLENYTKSYFGAFAKDKLTALQK